MKKFLEDLKKELKRNNISEEEIDEILEDHEEMIEEAIKEGLSEEELATKFGDPEKVAEEISNEKEQESEKIDKKENNKTPKNNWKFEVEKDKFDINISLVDEDINVIKSNNNELIIKYSGKGKVRDYNVEYKNGSLLVERVKSITKMLSFGRSYSGSFEILVPANKKVGYFKLKEVSGDVNIEQIDMEDLSLKTTSGDGELKQINTNDLKIETVSGDFSLNHLNADDCFISLVSGDFNAKDFYVKENIIVNSVSGDVKIENSDCKDLDFRTVSGDMNGIEFYPQSVGLKSVSGDVSIKNSDSGKNIQVRSKKTVSGDITILSK
jgi:DUF4097 and DUF4098 domain-containing protein YvlB